MELVLTGGLRVLFRLGQLDLSDSWGRSLVGSCSCCHISAVVGQQLLGLTSVDSGCAIVLQIKRNQFQKTPLCKTLGKKLKNKVYQDPQGHTKLGIKKLIDIDTLTHCHSLNAYLLWLLLFGGKSFRFYKCYLAENESAYKTFCSTRYAFWRKMVPILNNCGKNFIKIPSSYS